MTKSVPPDAKSLKELAWVFLKLGVTAFGGPAAHIALMENEFVRKRNWLSREEFLDLLGAASLIPGPSSSELAIYIGQKRCGIRGLWLAGFCFILPAAILVVAIAAVYGRYGGLPKVAGILYGIKPVIIAVILQALWGLGRTAVKSKELAVLGILAAIANAAGVNILVVLFGTGALTVLYGRIRPKTPGLGMAIIGGTLLTTGRWLAASAQHLHTDLLQLFLVFLKVGSVQFGSGYVLLAFLRADFVERLRWLTQSQLLDAVAVGQFTPGPVFTTATFIGYLLHGLPGALLATVGIFLPAFLLVTVSGHLIPKIRQSPVAGNFLDGVNVASLALMLVVSWQLGKASIIDIPTILLALGSLALLLRFRLNSAWLVLAGGVVGWLKFW